VAMLHTLVHNPLFWVAVGAVIFILVIAVRMSRKSETNEVISFGNSLQEVESKPVEVKPSVWDNVLFAEPPSPEERAYRQFEDRIS
jgi:hypothetical protein